MDDEVDAPAVATERHRHRVDQEGPVPSHQLDDRVPALPAVDLDVGVVDPEVRLARDAPDARLPVGQGRAVQLTGIADHQIGGRHPLVVAPDEVRHSDGVLAVEALERHARRPLHEVVVGVERTHRHVDSFRSTSRRCEVVALRPDGTAGTLDRGPAAWRR
jgi:hypothetical protein